MSDALRAALEVELRGQGVAMTARARWRLTLHCSAHRTRLSSDREAGGRHQRCAFDAATIANDGVAWERTASLLLSDLVRYARRSTPGVCQWQRDRATRRPAPDSPATTPPPAPEHRDPDGPLPGPSEAPLPLPDAESLTPPVADAPPPRRDAAPVAPAMSNPSRRLRVYVGALGFVGYSQVVAGGAALSLTVAGLWRGRIALDASLGVMTASASASDLGDARLLTVDAALGVMLRLAGGEAGASLWIGPGLRGGFARIEGVAARSMVTSSTVEGWWAAPTVKLAAWWPLSPHWGLMAELEAGWVLPGTELVATARRGCGEEVLIVRNCGDTQEVLALRGPTGRLSFGVRWGP